jgi:NAD(P)-dependent dehydrogenase (short-subunit alcohol dehydrogenase family)
MQMSFKGRVALVTGAGNGLGRAHAIGLAARGAKLVVNDFGGGLDGSGRSSGAAEAVVEHITSEGGEAIADGADVSDMVQVEAMVQRAKSVWGRVDILVNNAGILRDKTFLKLELSDFRAVLEVHLMGAVNCCKAVWQIMREQRYGRIAMTTSSSGLYGNYGQSNYGAAKAAVVGLMNVLHLEGAKYDIRVNALAPSAATRMTEGFIADKMWQLLEPESVTPGLLYLVSEGAPSRTILCAGAGAYAITRILETPGIYLPEGMRTPEAIAAKFADISDLTGARAFETAYEQTVKFAQMAADAKGIDLSARPAGPEHQ